MSSDIMLTSNHGIHAPSILTAALKLNKNKSGRRRAILMITAWIRCRKLAASILDGTTSYSIEGDTVVIHATPEQYAAVEALR